jgi:beta-lactamase superfamily II metal-dependent hydrolase
MHRASVAALSAALALAGSAGHAAEKPLQIVMVDVEGGAATMFVTPEGQSVLIDTGWPAGMGNPRPPANGPPPPPPPSSAERIVAAAAELGVKKIDYLVVTHYHVDHVGGVHELLARMPVGTFIDHGPNREEFTPQPPNSLTPNAGHPVSLYPKYEAATAGHNRRTVKPGDKITIGSLVLDFVTADGVAITEPLVAGLPPTPHCDVPGKSEIGGEENVRSTGFVATFGKARILDLADTTWDQEKKLVCPANLLGKIDLNIVSHHGSQLSSSPPLIAATAARVALVANGERKGGDKATLDSFASNVPKPVVWQVHQATRDPDANRPADYIANLDGVADNRYAIKAEVSKDGTIKVVNARNGFTETYPPGK